MRRSWRVAALLLLLSSSGGCAYVAGGTAIGALVGGVADQSADGAVVGGLIGALAGTLVGAAKVLSESKGDDESTLRPRLRTRQLAHRAPSALRPLRALQTPW